jgi:hypothetical protein
MTSYAASAAQRLPAASDRKISGAPSQRSLDRYSAENVIAAPAANAANQEYASRNGDSLSPV